MPAFLTHWRILIETARSNRDAGNDLGSLITDANAFRRHAHGWATPPQTTPAGAVWDTGPLPEVDFRFPGSDISAMAFLGALAPDVMYYHRRYLREKLTDMHLRLPPASSLEKRQPAQWSELFHRSHSGDLLILVLEQVALVPAPALRSQALAFALGYVSHIATDIALNPWINSLATRLPLRRAPGPHCSFEFLLDEYLASTYFEHPRYSLLRQPWGGYIEPAAHNLSQAGTPTAQLLQLLTSSAEIYQLNENQIETLPADFLAGLHGLRHFLSGRGKARWLALMAARKKVQPDYIHTLLNGSFEDTETIPSGQMLDYATRLSEHLCRLAISYYTALRNTNAEASERSSRRAALVNDLRNWNLHTGYDTIPENESKATSDTLHNWVHFAHLWEHSTPGQEQIVRLIGQTG